MGTTMFEKFTVEKAYGLTIDTTSVKPETIRDMKNMPIKDDDIIAVAYPKCGITWTQYIIWEILHGGIEPPGLLEMTKKDFPFIEIVGIDAATNMPSPRTIKFHSPYGITPLNSKAKYVVIFRNPFDACVSYFHHLKQRYLINLKQVMTFDAFFECYITGQINFGDYFDFVLSWYERRNDPNVLILFYEQMKPDHEGTVFKIANFLGEQYSKKIRSDPELLKKIVLYSSFKYMKENLPMANFLQVKNDEPSPSQPEKAPEKIEFFRKGEVGDWKTIFSEEQKKRMMEKFDKKFAGIEIKDLLLPPS